MTATASSAFSFTKRTTSTIQKFIPKLVDNISKRRSVLMALKAKGAQVMRQGGETQGLAELVLPVMTGLNGNFQWLGNDFQEITGNPIDGETVVGYNYSMAVCPVVLSWRQLQRNRSDAGVLNLLTDTLKQTEITMAENEEKAICSYGSLDNQPKGIRDIIFPYDGGTTGYTAWNTVGCIDSSAESWWRNQVVDAVLTSYPTLEEAFNYAAMAVEEYTGSVDLWIADRVGMQKVAAREFAKRTTMVSGRAAKPEMVDLGMTHLYLDDALMVWSHYLSNPSSATYGIAYGMDTEFTKLYINPKCNMKFIGMEPVRGDSTQLVEKGMFLHELVLATQARRTNVVVINIGKAS